MSYWFKYRDRDGRQKWVSAGIPFQALPVAVAIVVALLLPVVQFLRQLFH